MNSTFASHIEAVPKLFALLKEATPFVEKGLAAQRKRAGFMYSSRMTFRNTWGEQELFSKGFAAT